MRFDSEPHVSADLLSKKEPWYQSYRRLAGSHGRYGRLWWRENVVASSGFRTPNLRACNKSLRRLRYSCTTFHIYTTYHHHHHVPEGLGMFPVPWSSRWSWCLHLFLGRPMFLRPSGLYFSACFGSMFVSILCTCCSQPIQGTPKYS